MQGKCSKKGSRLFVIDNLIHLDAFSTQWAAVSTHSSEMRDEVQKLILPFLDGKFFETVLAKN
jgi:hypothetical protein